MSDHNCAFTGNCKYKSAFGQTCLRPNGEVCQNPMTSDEVRAYLNEQEEYQEPVPVYADDHAERFEAEGAFYSADLT